MEPKQFVNKLYESCEKTGIGEFQISYSLSGSEKISWFEGKVHQTGSSEVQKLVLKVKQGRNIGAFSCEELEEKNIDRIISEAVENARIVTAEEENFFHDGSGVYKEAVPYAPLADELKKLDKKAYLKAVEENVYALDKRVKKVITLSLTEQRKKFIMKNSLGVDLADEYHSAVAYLFVSAEENGVVKTGGYAVAFDKKDDFEPEYLARKAVDKAVRKLNAEDIVSCKTAVVFENSTFADLLEVFSVLFSANAVQEKLSQMGGKNGEKVASDIVTLIDDPFRKHGFETRRFDGEGYPSQTTPVVEKGILKTCLYNLRTAKKDGVKSTGNGSGGRGISFSNFYLKPGDMSKKEVLQKLGCGIYITGLSGLHAGFNSVSGDFSFGAEGFRVENGQIGAALNQFTISGNAYRLLKDIAAVGKDLIFDISNFGSPSVLVENLTISNV